MKNMKKVWPLLAVSLLLAVLTLSALAANQDPGYTDVPAGAWYADAVAYVRDAGIMGGTSDTAFSPDGVMTRSMAAAVLYRTAGSPAATGTADFTDVEPDAYYSAAVSWAAGQGILSGYGNGLFGPDDPVSRAQLATILWRYAGSPTVETGADFADESTIPTYAAAAVDWARADGIINGKDGNRFDPDGIATRAQMAVILRNFLSLNGGSPDTPPASEGDSPRVLVTWFSRVGNTEFPEGVDAVTSASINVRNGELAGNNQLVAEAVHNAVGGDLLPILVETPYPADYDETVSQSHGEQSSSTRPALRSQIDLADYDVIYLGYPIWAMTLPMPVETFLTQQDLSGKTIVPFCTHAGYGAGRTEERIRELCPDSTVLDVLAVDDADLSRAAELVDGWLEGLELPQSPAAQMQEITITIGSTVVTAQLNDTPAAQEFAASLPITVSMTRMGEHEYYGSLEAPLSEEGNTLQTGYEVGDLAFWTPGDLFALYFDEPQREPEGLMILGRITSDISIFDGMGNPETMHITLKEE